MVKSGKNQEILKDKIVYAVACECAAKLGKDSIQTGTIAFIGYEAPFIFAFDPVKTASPIKDSFATPVFEASNEIAVSLIKGNNIQQAFEKSQATFDKWIEKLQKSEAPPEAQHVLMTLFWNKSSQKFFGNKEAILT